MLTQELIKGLFVYREDGNLIRKTKVVNGPIGAVVGSLTSSTGRSTVSINNKAYLIHRLIFLYHHGYLPKVVDHKDRNPLNNRIENLRAATTAENVRNRKSNVSARSKYLGVGLHKHSNRWRAQITLDYKVTHIGYYGTEIEAALAYNKAARLHHKEFANLNIIEEDYSKAV
jgi:hypothetical protein